MMLKIHNVNTTEVVEAVEQDRSEIRVTCARATHALGR